MIRVFDRYWCRYETTKRGVAYSGSGVDHICAYGDHSWPSWCEWVIYSEAD